MCHPEQMLNACYTSREMFPAQMATALLSLCSAVRSAPLYLLFLRKIHLLTLKLQHHQRMLHMPDQSLTMTGRRFLCLFCLRARMSSYKALSLRHGTDGELLHLSVQTIYLMSSSQTSLVEAYSNGHSFHRRVDNSPYINLFFSSSTRSLL